MYFWSLLYMYCPLPHYSFQCKLCRRKSIKGYHLSYAAPFREWECETQIFLRSVHQHLLVALWSHLIFPHMTHVIIGIVGQ